MRGKFLKAVEVGALALALAVMFAGQASANEISGAASTSTQAATAQVNSAINQISSLSSKLSAGGVLSVTARAPETGVISAVQATTDLVSIAKQRKALMIDLAGKNPVAFLSVVMPAVKRNQLPVEVQAEIEKDTILTGKIQTLQVDDFSHPENSSFKNYLASGQNRYELYSPTSLGFISNTPIKVSGFLLGNAVVAGAQTDSVQVTGAVPQPESVGIQKTAILLVDFLDSGPRPFTPAAIKYYIFNGQFEKFYEEQSYGKVSFTGDVFGWYTLPRNAPSKACGAVDLDNDIPNLIAANNIDLSNYGRLVILPSHPRFEGGCSYIGKSDLSFNGKNYHISVAWVGADADYNTPSLWGVQPFEWTNLDFVLSHEMGHSLGVLHANGWDCGDKSLYNNCQHIEYGNYFDTMGNVGYSLQFNAFYKEMLGWLPTTRIKTLTPGISSKISPLESNSSSSIVLFKIPAAPNSASTPYYLEYRQGVGFDRNLDRADLVSNQRGVFINKMITSYSTPISRLVDARATTDLWYDDIKKTTINGTTFVDAGRGIRIQATIPRVTGPVASTISVGLDYQVPQCVRGAPGLYYVSYPHDVVTPGSYVFVGTAFNNNDYYACGPTKFVSSLSLPPQFTLSSVYNNEVTIAPEDNSQYYAYYATVYVPENTPFGVYTIHYTVRNAVSGLSSTSDIPITVGASRYFTVTSPNGGEKWARGETHNITWQSSGLDKVAINLIDFSSGNQYGVTSSVSASAGIYSWIIPANIPVGSNYKIFIGLESTGDYSDAPFTITAPAATATIQGYKVKMPGNASLSAAGYPDNQTVSVSGGASSSANPYWLTVNAGAAYTVSVTSPGAGWTVQSSLCIDSYSCHGSPDVTGTSRTVTIPAGSNHQADLWWHFTPPATAPTITVGQGPAIIQTNLQMGSTGVNLLNLTLKAPSSEGINLNGLRIILAGGGVAYFTNFTISGPGATLKGNVVNTGNIYVPYVAQFNWPSPFVIGAGSTVTFSVSADVPPYSSSTSYMVNQAFSLLVSTVTATGQSLNITATQTGSASSPIFTIVHSTGAIPDERVAGLSSMLESIRQILEALAESIR